MTDENPTMEELLNVANNVFRSTQKNLGEASLRGDLCIVHHAPDFLVSIEAVTTPDDADHYAKLCREQLFDFMVDHLKKGTASGCRELIVNDPPPSRQ